MYVCMHVCTKSFLKTTTNSSCVCTHLANKADSDSDSDSDSDVCNASMLIVSFFQKTKNRNLTDPTLVVYKMFLKVLQIYQINKISAQWFYHNGDNCSKIQDNFSYISYN